MLALRAPDEAARWLHARITGELRCDSRELRPGDGFLAWPGAAADGRLFVSDALRRGAVACLVEQEGCALDLAPEAPVATYPGLKAASGPIAVAYYGAPSEALNVVAVTGTNGKTSVAWWLAAALARLGPGLAPCALVGTLGSGVPPRLGAPGLTTPDPVTLQRDFRDFAAGGVRSCVLEASSIGLAEHRLDGSVIDVAIFTNFTQDHLDYHGTMEAYWRAKAALFDWPGLRAAVIGLDDPKGEALARHCDARGLEPWTYALQRPARLTASDLRHGPHGLACTLHEGEQAAALETALVGDYNVANVLAVIGALRALGVPFEDAVRSCADLPPVPGRMEALAVPGAPLAVVDFAHTPDALEHVLAALQPLAASRDGRLWCVFGCGGQRDHGKRPLMAAVAERLAARLVLTSDNPRGEDPAAILADMVAGLRDTTAARVEPDRARAIAFAIDHAAAADVVLIAGKGHERTQEIAGVRRPFSDQEQARAALRARRERAGALQ